MTRALYGAEKWGRTMKIRVIIKEPGRGSEYKYIENTLEELLAIVGGYIEVIPINNKVVVIQDIAGKDKQLDENIKIKSIQTYGTVVIAGKKIGNEFITPFTHQDLMEILEHIEDYVQQ